VASPEASASAETGHFFRAIRSGYATQLLVALTTFMGAVCQARLLGPAGRGQVVRFVNSSSLAALYLGFGIAPAITYYLSGRSIDRTQLVHSLARLLGLVTIVVAALALMAAASPLRDRLFPDSFSVGQCVVAMIVYFPFALAGVWCSAFILAHRVFVPVNMVALAAAVTNATISGILWVTRPAWGSGPGAIVVLMVVVEVCRFSALAMIALTVCRDQPRERLTGGGSPLRNLLSYSMYSYIGDAIQFVTYRADMWIIDAYHGAVDLGIYALAVTLSQLLWILPTTACSVIFAYVPGLERKAAAALTWRIGKLTGLASAVFALVGCLLSLFVVPLIFGEPFRAVPRLMAVLVFGVVPYSFTKVLAGYLSGIRALGWNLLLAAIGLTICLALDFALIPLGGAFGAALATAIAYSAHTILQVLVFKHMSGLSWSSLFTSPLADLRMLRSMRDLQTRAIALPMTD